MDDRDKNIDTFPPVLFPLRESPSPFDAFTDDGLREGTTPISRYEARVLLDHHLTNIVELEAEYELLGVASGTTMRRAGYLEMRLHSFISAGLLTYEEVKARYVRARELRGFDVTTELGRAAGDPDGEDMPESFDIEAAADEHAGWVADQPVRHSPDFDWSLI